MPLPLAAYLHQFATNLHYMVISHVTGPARQHTCAMVHECMASLWMAVCRRSPDRRWHRLRTHIAAMPGALLHDVSPGVLTMTGVPVIYLFVNMRSRFFYVGQTLDPRRGSEEYTTRILRTQDDLHCRHAQPFFTIIRGSTGVLDTIRRRLSHWCLVPIAVAPTDMPLRLRMETLCIRARDPPLNAPRVFDLLDALVTNPKEVPAHRRFQQTAQLHLSGHRHKTYSRARRKAAQHRITQPQYAVTDMLQRQSRWPMPWLTATGGLRPPCCVD